MQTTQMDYHNAVLLHPTVDGLAIKPDGVYVDVTFGGGGHSREILNRLGPKGKLIAFDQDKDALLNTIVKYPVSSCDFNTKSGDIKNKKMGYYYI